jgi:hypothetical protein
MEEKLHRRWVKIGGKKGSIFNGNFQRVTPYGNGAKIDAQKKHIGKRVYVIVLKD